MVGASPAWAHKEAPILECVFKDIGTGQYNSLWGYNNSSGSVETIAVGSSNGLTRARRAADSPPRSNRARSTTSS